MSDCGSLYHSGKPKPDHNTRKALLILGPNDTVAVDGYGEMMVVERRDVFFGPEIRVDQDGQNYSLIPAGFAKHPELWKADQDEEGWISGWELIDNVALEVAEVGKSLRCPICNEVLQNSLERRMALMGGVCPHD